MKIVINVCYGGFGLSSKALAAYYSRKGIPKVYFYRFGKYVSVENAAFYGWDVCLSEYFGEELKTEISQREGKWKNKLLRYYDIPRDDADLVAVVEEFGKQANTGFSELRIIEIDDERSWQILEYDGKEYVEW